MAKPGTSLTGILKQLDREIPTKQRELNELVAARKAVSEAILATATQPSKPRRPRSDGASRKTMVQTILASSPTPVSVDDIVAEMAKHGQQVDKPAVRGSLQYLKAKGVVKQPERGLWQSVTELQETAA